MGIYFNDQMAEKGETEKERKRMHNVLKGLLLAFNEKEDKMHSAMSADRERLENVQNTIKQEMASFMMMKQKSPKKHHADPFCSYSVKTNVRENKEPDKIQELMDQITEMERINRLK